MEHEFNLLEEPWILVRASDCSVKEVSLTDALLHAHEYADLAGELETQDVAVLRLMIAVLATVFSRVNQAGEPYETEDPADLLELWENLWEEGQFPQTPILEYFEEWKDRFWLFDENFPFFQVSEASKGTEYSAAKLVGELSESSNKIRLFPVRNGEAKRYLTYAESARWLLYVNAYDDMSSKPKGSNLPSPGVGWLGKLGLVYAVGGNLFETLMLNLTLLKNGSELWGINEKGGQGCPVWEYPVPRSAERCEIPQPDTLASLYTLQSRRLLLRRENGRVCGYCLLGGDFFQPSNSNSEQMTMWQGIKDKKTGVIEWKPKRHDPTRQFWREFPVFAIRKDDHTRPGICEWISLLEAEKILPDNIVCMRIASVQYGDKDFFVTDAYSDSVAFHADLLTDLGGAWHPLIELEISNCERIAYQLGLLCKDLCIAEGTDPVSNEKAVNAEIEKGKASFFAEIDIPFKVWIESLNSNQTDEERFELCMDWRNKATAIAEKLGKDLFKQAGIPAFIGREVTQENKKTKVKVTRHYSSVEAYRTYRYYLEKILGKE